MACNFGKEARGLLLVHCSCSSSCGSSHLISLCLDAMDSYAAIARWTSFGSIVLWVVSQWVWHSALIGKGSTDVGMLTIRLLGQQVQ
jgi:hypothetical protein